MAKQTPVRLGIIGTGIFARDAHLPSLQALGDTFEVVAIHAPSRESMAAFEARWGSALTQYDDVDDLLARDDIEAVAVIVPIPVLPEVALRALAAGKHVISEKPVAPDLVTGRAALAEYRTHYPDLIWMVGENWRYESSFVAAAQLVRDGTLGQVTLCHWGMHLNFPDGKYYHTMWRRKPTFATGLLLDGGVHHMAALRMILGEITSVQAQATLLRDDLAPVDTLSAALCFESGLLGSYAVTYTSSEWWGDPLHIAGTGGGLRIWPGRYELTTRDQVCTRTLSRHDGVQRELAAFAAAIRTGAPHSNSPEQALQDVAVVEAMLQSAQRAERVDVPTDLIC